MSTEKPSVEGLMALVKRYGDYCAFSEHSEDAGAAARFDAIRTYATSLCAPSVEPPKDYVLVRLKRPEGYEDVHDEYVLEDAGINPAFQPEIVYASPSAPQPAEPRGDVVVTKNMAGQIVAVTRQDDEGRILSVIAESAAPQPVAVEPRPVTAREDKALRAAIKASAKVVAPGRLAASSPQEKDGGETPRRPQEWMAPEKEPRFQPREET